MAAIFNTMVKRFQRDTDGTLLTNLISHWDMEDLIDFYGSNNFTNNGSAVFSAGKINNAVDFGAANATKYLSCGNLGVNGGLVSMDCWVNITTAPAAGTGYAILSQGNNTAMVAYSLIYQNTGGVYTVEFHRNRYAVLNNVAASTFTLTPGTWYHIMGVYDGTNITVYINNANSATTTGSGNGSNAYGDGFLVGRAIYTGSFTSGLVDLANVWSKALSANERADQYNSGSGNPMQIRNFAFYKPIRGSIGAFFKNDPALVLYEQFNGNSLDNSGNGRNGTDTAMAYVPSDQRDKQVALFNGSASYIGLGDILGTVFLGAHTIILRGVKWNSLAMPTGGAQMLIHKSQSAGYPYPFYHYIDATNFNIGFGTGATQAFAYASLASLGIAVGKIYDIIITEDGATFPGGAKLYINGVPQSLTYQANLTPVNGAVVMEIGRWSNNTDWFNGSMSEVAIFSRQLSPVEISQYTKWSKSPNIIQRKGFLWALTAITLTLTETITTTDTILRSILRTLSESITTSDTISNIKVMFKALTESITTSDSILRTVSRTLSETISTTDAIMKQLGRTLTEAITTTDTFAKIRSTTITFIEKFSIVQFLTNLLNGGTGIWTKESGATSTWTPEAEPTTNWPQEPYP